MTIALFVMAGVFATLLVATMALSDNWLAAGIRGTVRQGVLGVTFFAPAVVLLALFGVCIYAVVASILYVMDLVK